MFRLIRKFGEFLDAIDLGGWTCLLLGMGIVSVTVLAPAWREVEMIKFDQAVLRQQAGMIAARERNYQAFLAALEHNDPLLLQRLAWHHLKLKPIGSESVEYVSRAAAQQDLSIDAWMEPVDLKPVAAMAMEPLPDTRLVRWVLGPSRLWVLAFGGWLILIGLLVNPRAALERQAASATTPPRVPPAIV